MVFSVRAVSFFHQIRPVPRPATGRASSSNRGQAALQALRRAHPAHFVVAVPVAPPDTLARLSNEADETVCLMQPHEFSAVGQFYKDFNQTSDEEVSALLNPFKQGECEAE